MSATYFLKHRGQYQRVTFSVGKTVIETVGRNQATPFTSEADAWLAVHQHHLRSDWCEVVSAATEQLQPA